MGVFSVLVVDSVPKNIGIIANTGHFGRFGGQKKLFRRFVPVTGE